MGSNSPNVSGQRATSLPSDGVLEIDVAAAWCWGSHGFDVDFPRDGARAVVFGVLAEVVGQIGPAATDADHDTLALADEATDWILTVDDDDPPADRDRLAALCRLIADDRDPPTIGAVVELLVEVLEEAGYLVIAAEDGPSGLRVLQSGRRIDLLVTDVGLPGGMNGRQIADAARVVRPGLKVIFITGYAENAALGDGHLASGMTIVTKPFELAALVRKVADVLDS